MDDDMRLVMDTPSAHILRGARYRGDAPGKVSMVHHKGRTSADPGKGGSVRYPDIPFRW